MLYGTRNRLYAKQSLLYILFAEHVALDATASLVLVEQLALALLSSFCRSARTCSCSASTCALSAACSAAWRPPRRRPCQLRPAACPRAPALFLSQSLSQTCCVSRVHRALIILTSRLREAGAPVRLFGAGASRVLAHERHAGRLGRGVPTALKSNSSDLATGPPSFRGPAISSPSSSSLRVACR